MDASVSEMEMVRPEAETMITSGPERRNSGRRPAESKRMVGCAKAAATISVGLLIFACSCACIADARIRFVPPQNWSRTSTTAAAFAGLVGAWVSPRPAANSFRQNINLRFVDVPGPLTLNVILTNDLTNMLERAPTLQVLRRRKNSRCEPGTSEVVELRAVAINGSSQDFEVVATRVRAGVYIATYTRGTGDTPDPKAQESVEAMCSTG